MTEKWVSQAKHWCTICKVWTDGKKLSINIHENGRGHKEKLQTHLEEQRRRRSNNGLGSRELDNELRAIEAAAASSFAQDVRSGNASGTAWRSRPQPRLGGPGGFRPGGFRNSGDKPQDNNTMSSNAADLVAKYNQQYGHEEDPLLQQQEEPAQPEPLVIPPAPDYHDPAYAQWYYTYAAAAAAQAAAAAENAGTTTEQESFESSEMPPALESHESNSASASATDAAARSSVPIARTSAPVGAAAKKSVMSFNIGKPKEEDAPAEPVPADENTGLGKWQSTIVKAAPQSKPAPAANATSALSAVPKKRKIGDANSDDDEEASREYLAAYGFSSILAAPKRDDEPAEPPSTGATVAFKQRKPMGARAVRTKVAANGSEGVSADTEE